MYHGGRVAEWHIETTTLSQNFLETDGFDCSRSTIVYLQSIPSPPPSPPPHRRPDIRSDAAFQAAIFQRIEQCCQHARAACAEWMSECDRAAIDVDLVPVPALVGEGVTICKNLRGEGFVEFDQVNIASMSSRFS